MTPARRLVAALATLAAAFAPAGASGQQAALHTFPGTADGARPPIPDVPSGPATIRGRVVHDQESDASGGVPVILYSMSPDGVSGLRGMVSDAAGSFSFEGVTNDPEIVYLLGAQYREALFDIRFSFQAGEFERDLELSITDPTADATGAHVADAVIQIEQSCAGLSIHESHLVENSGDRVIYIPESDRVGREPILHVVLPDGAGELRSALGDNLESQGNTLSYWGPLRPGRHDLEFSYGIPERGASFDVRRTFPSGAQRVRLLSHSSGPTLTPGESDDAVLRPGEPVELDGQQFDTLVTGPIAPGGGLNVHIELAPERESPAGLSARETRLWLDLDGAAITVDQQHTLEVGDSGPLVSVSGAPLLCIPLPDGAEAMRFSSSTLALGLSRDPSGALAIRGPLPTGEVEIAIRYRLPLPPGVPRFAHAMPLDVPLLTVLIADTGLVVETGRLHRRRPMRTSDRSYLHLEGFEIPAGELVELTLRPLETRRPLPKLAAAGIAVATAALVIGFLIAPLRRSTTETTAAPQADDSAAQEREAVLDAIHGLDDDFEMGKLAEPDYREMRLTLRAEAVELLRMERAASSEPVANASDPPLCPRCGADVATDSRFCSQCGVQLIDRGSPDEAESA